MGRRIFPWLFVMWFFVSGASTPSAAQMPAAQRTAYEFSAAWLGLAPRGDVKTNSNTVNFSSDLGMESLQSQVRFRFGIRPSDRKRIQIDFLPYRFDGETTIERSFRFGGVTYDIDERVTSKASLNYIAGAFQYDFVHQPSLSVGVIGAVAYLGLKAEASSPSAGPSEVKRRIAFPLAGAAVRISPSRLSWLTIRAEGRGMSFGSYGRYVEGAGGIGFRVAPHVTVEGGYYVVDGDGHHGTRGAKFRFSGPSIGLWIHDNWF
jgi:hypothetical protein